MPLPPVSARPSFTPPWRDPNYVAPRSHKNDGLSEGTSGGRNREYYKDYYTAECKGNTALAKYKENMDCRPAQEELLLKRARSDELQRLEAMSC